MCAGAVEAEAVCPTDGLRLRAHFQRGAQPYVGRGSAGLLPLRHAQPSGSTLACHRLPERVRMVSARRMMPLEARSDGWGEGAFEKRQGIGDGEGGGKSLLLGCRPATAPAVQESRVWLTGCMTKFDAIGRGTRPCRP